jgi:L-amino acid N-acyltransferase YncA
LYLTRPSRDKDVVAITVIYGHHVLTGTGTFEIAPTEADRASRQARWGAQIFLAVIGDSADAGSIWS